MSFMTTDEIIEVGENMVAKVIKDVKGVDVKLPLPRMTWMKRWKLMVLINQISVLI